MARTTSFSALLFASFAFALAIFASQAQAQNVTKPECQPLHGLYKAWVAPCTKDGTAVPSSDADPAWKPCICKDGFFHLAVASESCAIANTARTRLITDVGLDNLCKDFKGYVPAATQKPLPDLAPALATVTSISNAPAAPTDTAGSDSDASGSAAGMTSPSSQNLLMVVASFVAVVLATSAAF